MTTNTLGSEPAFRPKPATAWLLPFAPMGFAAFSLSALVFFHLRQDAFEVQSALQHAYAALYRTIGFAPAVMFFGLVILWSTIWLANGTLKRPLHRLGRLAAMAVLLGVLLNLGDGGVSPALHKGAIGAAVAQALVSAVGYWPSLVLVWAVTFASLLLATDFFFQESFERMFAVPRAEGPGQGDAGVEPVASDRLRDVAGAAEPVADAAATPAPVEVEPTRRRRSYDERRAEREAMASRWSALADAPARSEATVDEPVATASAASEASAADAFGLSAARVVDAIDAAAELASAAVESDVPEALQREAADDGYTPAMPSAQRTPILFPDEMPPAGSVPSAAEATPLAADEWPPAPVVADAAANGVDAGANANEAIAAHAAPATDAGDSAAVVDDGDDALGLGDEVFVLADSNDPGYAASFGAVAEDAEDEDVDAEAVDAEAIDAELAPVTASDDVTAHVAVGASVVADESAAAPMKAISEQTEAATATPVEAAVAIPRPDAVPARAASGLDEALVGEAVDLVTSARRANTVFLQRKLRVDYDVAAALLAELAARGVVALDADATHGRVLR